MKGMDAHLFNIQKFSLHDGPGIRTTVFFKGCPLRCKWCANPESQSASPDLAGEARHYSLAEVAEICLQDRPFFEESGGGVTLSGGEVLAQGEFAAALLDVLRKEGVRTAVETSGCGESEVFDQICSLADLILFDIKHYEAGRHIEGTGAGNGIILTNLKNALAGGVSVLPRLPVIRGYNDSLEDAREFASFLKALGLERAQLLPFHQLGERKYEELNMPYAFHGIPPLHKEDIEEFRQVIATCGIDCWV